MLKNQGSMLNDLVKTSATKKKRILSYLLRTISKNPKEKAFKGDNSEKKFKNLNLKNFSGPHEELYAKTSRFYVKRCGQERME